MYQDDGGSPVDYKAEHDKLKLEHEMLNRMHSNLTGAMNNLQGQMEQLYADVAAKLSPEQAAFWRTHLGLPLLAFARTYTNFNFATALLLAVNGRRVQRAGWNGKGMFVTCIQQWGAQMDVSDLPGIRLHPFLVMKTADNTLVPWLVSQTDLLAGDWQLWVPTATEEVPTGEKLQ